MSNPLYFPNDTRNVGTAKKLFGKIYILSFFVSTPKHTWTKRQINKTIYQLYEAEDWLREQSAKYGSHIEFINEMFDKEFNLYADYVPTYLESGSSYEFSKEIVLKTGFTDILSYIQFANDRTKCDQFFSLIFICDSGRSYACPVTKECNDYDSEKYNAEACVIFRENLIFRKYNPSIFAHEILHLFGAWDLYSLNKDDKQRANLAKEIFPNSIMIDVYRSLRKLEIDKLTAWLIGISDKSERWYLQLNPYQNSI